MSFGVKKERERLKILVKIYVIATLIIIEWSAESMSDNIRFFYTCTYIDLVSIIASRLHALNEELKKNLLLI